MRMVPVIVFEFCGESRIIRMGYGADEVYTRSALRALQLWKEFFLTRLVEPLFHQTGVLWLAHEDDPIRCGRPRRSDPQHSF